MAMPLVAAAMNPSMAPEFPSAVSDSDPRSVDQFDDLNSCRNIGLGRCHRLESPIRNGRAIECHRNPIVGHDEVGNRGDRILGNAQSEAWVKTILSAAASTAQVDRPRTAVVPALIVTVSLPAPVLIVPPPLPRLIVSSPPPALMLSAPAPPLIVSANDEPVRLSLKAVPITPSMLL